MLTAGDRQILPLAYRSTGGFDIGCRWYFNGFTPLPYQYAWHHIPQMNTTLLGGIAVGKSKILTASYAIDALSIPYWKGLSTSVTANQAEIPFNMFMEWYEDNPKLKHRVVDITLRPWPIITFDIFSTWEFRTAGYDAKFIRGKEYDRISCDEFQLDYEGIAVKTLRGRLRGRRPNGIARMCRLDILGTPSDAPWLRERFERGWSESLTFDPKHYLSMRVRTRDNIQLTEEQIALMEAEYSDDMIDVEMNAMFPDYGMAFLPSRHIQACTSQHMYDEVYEALHPEEEGAKVKKGYVLEEHPRFGVTKIEFPYRDDARYIMAGDPGQDNPPKNNSPCVIVFDASKKPYKLAYFHWIHGNGEYTPFLDSFKYAMEKYRPYLRFIDTTGTQQAIAELAFEKQGLNVDGIAFNRDKEGMLNALNLEVSEQNFRWPLIAGFVKQLSSYSRELDKKNDFPKDITMTMALIAFATRFIPTEDVRNDGIRKAVAGRRRRRR